MGAKADEIAAKLNGIAGYKSQFQKVFGSDATPDNIYQSDHVRLSARSSAATRRTIAGRLAIKSAISDEAKRGEKLFKDLKCTNCHDGVLFTDQQYHNVGIGMDAERAGRGTVQSEQQAARHGRFQDAHPARHLEVSSLFS